MPASNCYHCRYFSKHPGAGNYFIYKCAYWGLVTQNVLPQSAVISSIGKKCPFFLKKEIKQKKDESEPPSGNNNEYDLLI